MRELVLIAAVAQNGVIGAEGGIPWKVSEDMKRFRALTNGHVLIMGRKTHESIGRPLPNRRTIVISRDPSLSFEGCEMATSLEQALEMAYATDATPFVAGGGVIYELALPFATTLEITEIDRDVEGDTVFPSIDPAVFERVEARPGETEGVTFVRYRRIGA